MCSRSCTVIPTSWPLSEFRGRDTLARLRLRYAFLPRGYIFERLKARLSLRWLSGLLLSLKVLSIPADSNGMDKIEQELHQDFVDNQLPEGLYLQWIMADESLEIRDAQGVVWVYFTRGGNEDPAYWCENMVLKTCRALGVTVGNDDGAVGDDESGNFMEVERMVRAFGAFYSNDDGMMTHIRQTR